MSLKNGITIVPNTATEIEREELLRSANREQINPRAKDVNVPPSYWMPERVSREHPRLRKPEPATADQLTEEIEGLRKQLAETSDFYCENKGKDRFEKERKELTNYLALHQARCQAFAKRLEEIEKAKTVEGEYCDRVSAAETGVRNVAAKMVEHLRERIARERYGVEQFSELHKSTQHDVIVSLKHTAAYTTRWHTRFGVSPKLEQAAETIKRLFETLTTLSERLTK